MLLPVQKYQLSISYNVRQIRTTCNDLKIVLFRKSARPIRTARAIQTFASCRLMSSPYVLESDDEPQSKRARIEAEAVDSKHQTSNLKDSPDPVNPSSLAYRLGQYGSAHAGPTSAERLVGISGYVNTTLPPFVAAIIKHRFTDFLVWEISKGGHLVKLTDIARPTTPAFTSTTNDGQEGSNEGEGEEVIKLEEFMSKEKLEELQTFFETGLSKDAVIYTDVCSLS